MDQVRRALANIREHLGRLNASQRLLLGALAVIMVMVLFFVTLYAGSPAMVTLYREGTPVDDVERAKAWLDSAGIQYKAVNGAILVPAERKSAVLAQLAQAGQLPADKSILFSNLGEQISWTDSKDLQRDKARFALQNELARVLADFDGIAKASVFIDVPVQYALGQPARKPTAAVTVFTSPGRGLDQKTVDAVAGFVAGSLAGLTTETVRVIDGSNSQQRKATSADDLIPMTYMQHVTFVENQTREKLLALLGHIPGVVIAVTAQVDVSRAKIVEDRVLPKGQGTEQLLRSERAAEQNQTEEVRAAEPGPRSNQAASINRSGGAGSKLNTTENDTEFENAFGKRVTETLDPRGMPTHLAVSVNIPRGYFLRILDRRRAAAGGAGGEPSEEEVETTFKAEERRIVGLIRPHVAAMTAAEASGQPDLEERITVAMIPLDEMGPPAAEPTSLAGWFGSGGLAFGPGGRLVETVVLSTLALAAVALMLSMVRKAGRKVELPSPEELVGIPPALAGDMDLVGEADEGDTAMAGIEVNDQQLKMKKMLEQVTGLVTKNPGDAAKLLNRWVVLEE